MKIWKFDVELVETFNENFEIEAETKEEAIEELKYQLEQESISERRNTYIGSELIVLLGKEEIDIYK